MHIFDERGINKTRFLSRRFPSVMESSFQNRKLTFRHSNVVEGEKEDIDKAVIAARKAFDEGPWRKMTTSERGQLIWRLADLLERHSEEFAQLESLDNGKPLKVARVADIPLSVDLFRYMAGWTTKIEGNTIPLSGSSRYFAYTLREPIGVVGQIIPWNFPLLGANEAENTIILTNDSSLLRCSYFAVHDTLSNATPSRRN